MAAPRGRRGRGIAAALAAIALLWLVAGLVLDGAGVGLGTELPPFFATWSPSVDSEAALALPVLAGALGAGVALVRWRGGTAAFLVAATATAAVARLALAAAGRGQDSWASVFGLDPEAANEYLPALPALDRGVGPFLDRFAEIAPSLPIHPSAHPPGMLLLLDGLGAGTPREMATLVIVAGLAVVPLTYALARRAGHDPGRSRIAALLMAFSPAGMIYGVTSADALFASAGLLAGVLLLGDRGQRALGAAALALAALLSWALLAIGAFAAFLVAIRRGLRWAFELAAAAGLAFAGLNFALWATWGYDPVGALAAASEVYELGISNARPYAYWVLGSPVAWALASGLPLAWYGARALELRAPVAIALAGIVVVAALLGFSKAETERIWLFMTPLLAVAAAAAVPRDRTGALLALLVAQAVAMELLLDTVW